MTCFQLLEDARLDFLDPPTFVFLGLAQAPTRLAAEPLLPCAGSPAHRAALLLLRWCSISRLLEPGFRPDLDLEKLHARVPGVRGCRWPAPPTTDSQPCVAPHLSRPGRSRHSQLPPELHRSAG